VLRNLYLLRLGFDARFIGLLLGTGQLVWAATALPAGVLSNRFGSRNSMIFGLSVISVGLAMVPLVESWPEPQWRTWLLLGIIVENFGAGFATVNFSPFMMAVTHEHERRHAFAIFQAFNPATAFLGSLLAGALPVLFAHWLGLTLEQAAPYRLALWFASPLLFAAIIPLLGADRAKLSTRDKQESSTETAPVKWLMLFGIFVFLQVIGEGVIRPFFNVYLDTELAVPADQIGFVMGVAQLLPVVAALATPLLITKFGTGRALVIVTIGISLCLLPLATEPPLVVAALSYMGTIAMVTVNNTTRGLFGQESVTPRWRTTISGVLIIGVALGWAVAGIVGGYLIEAVGFGVIFLVGATLSLLAAGMLLGFLRGQGTTKAASLSSNLTTDMKDGVT
jgi:MFS family permease